MGEKVSAKSILDFTAVITIGSILLYQLGWVYWETFLNHFNINSSFIDIPFEKIISTTWTSILFIIIGFSRSIETAYFLQEEDKFSIVDALFFLLSGILLILFFHSTRYWFSLLCCFLILSSVYAKISSDFKVRIGYIRRKYYAIGIAVVIYLFSYGLYYYKANWNAEKIISNYENDIEVIMKDNNKTISGKFIIFMNDKYYILTENSKCQRELLIINNNEINHSKFKY